MSRRIALGCLVILFLSAWAIRPAHAIDEAPTTDVPAVLYGLKALDGTTPHVVVLQATDRTWRSRLVARVYDLAVPGLDVRTGACAPDLPCIRVHVGTWSPEAALETSGSTAYWSGLCVYTSDSVRDVFLNRARIHQGVGRTRVAAHEIGHALGLVHHHGEGVMGAWKSWQWRPSDAEAAALAAYYSGPFA